MDFELSDEQQFLREAARGALSRHQTVEAAREALDGGERLDLWDTGREAGWPGLLGHVPATAILDSTQSEHDDLLRGLAEGEKRAAFVGAQPPEADGAEWTVDPEGGHGRSPAPQANFDDGQTTVTGTVAWVPDAPEADVLVVVATGDDGSPVAVLVDAQADGVSIEPVTRYDGSRSLGHVRLESAAGASLGVDEDVLRSAWHLAQGLVAAESLGAVEACLEVSVAYAKERYTFGRPIGSYQAVKHGLVEILRRQENARSLMYYAGWARQDAPDEFPLAASAARVAAGGALDYAARENISVHGGIGATWEHDAPLYFRRAQLSRRLLGGTGGATDRVAGELLAQAGTAA